MTRLRHGFHALSHFAHQQFLWFLIASYVVAALWPGLGLWMRGVILGHFEFLGERTTVTLPMLMLALLLVNAGLGVQLARLRGLFVRPLPLLIGLLANLCIPIAFIFVVTLGLRFWPDQVEVQNILVGLALVASMPIAGSSTAWAQNNNADLALSLGLVLFSTLLSPLTTPVALHAVGLMARGVYAQELHNLASYGTGWFLAVCVMLPSLLGILLNTGLGPQRVARVRPSLKMLNMVNLLLLNYSNASVSLPQTLAEQDWDFLSVTLVIAVSLCVLAFFSGWLIGRLLKTGRDQQASLVFGLGMNNNGTGLVLASLTLASFPGVMLPIIFYNLVQHLIAGTADFILARTRPDPEPDGAARPEEPRRPLRLSA